MSDLAGVNDRLLPLGLCATPPAVEMVLAQEGVPFVKFDRPSHASSNPLFVLYDSDSAFSRRSVRNVQGTSHHIDVAALRRDFPADPFAALVDTGSGVRSWQFGATEIRETVSRVDKAALRDAVACWLRNAIVERGGVWLRLGRFPYPFRSAFNFRVDLDEHEPADYHAFSRARTAIATCTTHFVSTAAYGDDAEVLRDLRRHDTQSHGHFHHVYRDELSNRRNLLRAHECLTQKGFQPVGFAGPGGRWNLQLNRVLEELGYLYSSEFGLQFDDWPFFPWLGERFSSVLQVPIHPVCEGLFFEQAGAKAGLVADYLVSVLRRKIAAGLPAFLYGHPERRLGKFPAIVERLGAAVAAESLVWKTTLTEYARWWIRRAAIQFSVTRRADGVLCVEFKPNPTRDRVCLEIEQPDGTATIPVEDRILLIPSQEIEYRASTHRFDQPHGSSVRGPWGMKAPLRRWLDWETVTPREELAADSPGRWLKKCLRGLHDLQRESA